VTDAVVDANVAVKRLVPQPDSDRAVGVVKDFNLLAPALLLVEPANDLWKHQRLGKLSPEAAAAAIEGLETVYFTCVALDETLTTEAFRIAAAISPSVYDCIYPALSNRNKASPITPDQRLGQKARDTGFAIIDLGGLPETAS
jgi:predicted nucleic acid-binding protein